jgi:hypothetical protein
MGQPRFGQDLSPFRTHRCDAAPAPTGFAEIVSDDFPILHVMSSVAPFRKTAWLKPYRFSARRGGEFLEARIISERVPGWIKL